MSLTLLSAKQFSIEELTEAYNMARVDYLVPMPMSAARLAEYMRVYDIDLSRSVVAVLDDEVVGINLLGVRDGRSWITRMGVSPKSRRQNAGGSMMDYLLDKSADAGHDLCILEVIHGNEPAHRLFLKKGFCETRELLILRRPPKATIGVEGCSYSWLESAQAIKALSEYPGLLAWTNQPETYLNSGDAVGLRCELPQGDRGWIVFRKQRFNLSHFVLHTEKGDAVKVGLALLQKVYERFSKMDTHTENIASDDVHLPALWELGFVEAFRRIEMYRERIA